MLHRRHAWSAVLGFLLVAATAASASAQQGRLRGVVLDEDRQPIRGATVTAENPNNFGPTRITATTDEKGRFSMIGLRLGQWRLVAFAPGYSPQAGTANVRPIVAVGPPVTFTLAKTGPATMGVLANISAKDLQDQLAGADALLADGKWDDAIEACRAILTKTPSLVNVHLQIAAAHRGKKDYDAAIASYNSLLETDPSNGRAHVEMARTYLERGDARMAEEALLKAAGGEETSGEVFLALGELLLSRKETEGASEWFTKAAATDPSWGKPRYHLGELALGGGDRDHAHKLMSEVIAVDPSSPEAALAKAALDQLNR
jgi:Flp pilus assembly protein TadD